MKKDKPKSVKKTIRERIQLGLIKELKTLTGKFGPASEKLVKEITKGAEKLAKKIVKELKIEGEAKPAAVKETKAAFKKPAAVKAPVAVKTSVAITKKPATKAPAVAAKTPKASVAKAPIAIAKKGKAKTPVKK